jgi:hypothetical protein
MQHRGALKEHRPPGTLFDASHEFRRTLFHIATRRNCLSLAPGCDEVEELRHGGLELRSIGVPQMHDGVERRVGYTGLVTVDGVYPSLERENGFGHHRGLLAARWRSGDHDADDA